MRPKGTIYQFGKSGTHGEIILFIPFLIRILFHFLRGIGAGMIAFAVLTFSFSFGPVFKQEIQYFLEDKGFVTSSNPNSNSEEFPVVVAEAERVASVQKDAINYGVNSYFSVVIPKISASANIIANIDAGEPDEYLDALKKGVVHAKGTYFPGQLGRIFLFSHSTDSPLNFARYNAVFYLLKKLEKGDTVIVFFANKRYEYEVSEKIITNSKDTSWLQPKLGFEELILMTCDPPGTTWNRLLIVAKPKL